MEIFKCTLSWPEVLDEWSTGSKRRFNDNFPDKWIRNLVVNWEPTQLTLAKKSILSLKRQNAITKFSHLYRTQLTTNLKPKNGLIQHGMSFYSFLPSLADKIDSCINFAKLSISIQVRRRRGISTRCKRFEALKNAELLHEASPETILFVLIPFPKTRQQPYESKTSQIAETIAIYLAQNKVIQETMYSRY